LRGQKTCGYGSRKKHRGKGSKGGKGMAGTGKRAGQKLTFIHKYMPGYFGRRGFKSLKQIMQAKPKTINLFEIQGKIDKFVAEGKAKKTAEGIELDLHDYKILAKGDVKDKFLIKAKSASSQAQEKVKKAGGKIIAAEQQSAEQK
jgi:large subunit ribosomal protein L15